MSLLLQYPSPSRLASQFFNIKCRTSGLQPQAAVIVATVRALKSHGGGPAVEPGKALDAVYTTENLDLLAKGTCNLKHHIKNALKFGVLVRASSIYHSMALR